MLVTTSAISCNFNIYFYDYFSVFQVGNILTIIGSGFNQTAANTVTVGSSICVVGFANANSLNCTLGHQTAGIYPVTVNVNGKGLTNNLMFTYQLSLSGISPITGNITIMQNRINTNS